MKKITFLLFSVMIYPTLIFAQGALQQGLITYDMALQLKAQMAKQNPAAAALVPDEVHLTTIVAFKKEQFSVINKKKAAPQQTAKTPQDGVTALITEAMSASDDARQYIDLKKRTIHEENTFNNKTYYTETAIAPAIDIVYTKEVKKILGYTCSKAIVTDSDKKKYTVWYTTSVPYAYAPDGSFANLKGAVLEFESEEIVCKAIRIENKAVTANQITPDPKAKRVTKDQMQDLEDDNTANMMKVMKEKATGKGTKNTTTQSMIIKM